MNDLSNLIRESRKELGWSQEYVAEKAGISPATYWRIENGEVNVKYSTILSVLNALHLQQNIRPLR